MGGGEHAGLHIGGPSFEDRPALMYGIETARNICGMAPGTARKLLEMALQELDGKEDLRPGES